MRFAQRDYFGKKINMEGLKNIIMDFFAEEGFRVKWFSHPDGFVIQAHKGGVFRPILGKDGAFTLTVEGDEINYKVRIGIAKWMEDQNEKRIEKILLHPSTEYMEVPESLWTYEMEHHLWHYVETQIDLGAI